MLQSSDVTAVNLFHAVPSDPDEARADQVTAYTQFFRNLGEYANQIAVGQMLSQWMQECLANRDLVGDSSLPLMTRRKVLDIQRTIEAASSDPRGRTGIAWMFMAAPIVELTEQGFSLPALQGSAETLFTIGAARYLAARTALEQRERLRVEAEAETVLAKKQLLDATAEIDVMLNERRTTHETMLLMYNDLDGKITKSEASLTDARDELLQFKQTIRAQLELEGARVSWVGLSTSTLTTARWAGGLVAGLIVLPFIILPCIADSLTYFINKPDIGSLFSATITGSAFAHQLTKLVVLTVPTVAYFWALRVALRFYTRSLAVYDDARHRSVMLETYFNLTSEGRADAKDKPIILSALFRPGPSIGPDSNEPIDLAAVVEGVTKAQR